MRSATLLLCIIALAGSVAAATQFPEEFYGYQTISTVYDSHMFYAIRGNKDPALRAKQPLVMWLQGGPGASSAFANFLENGPEELVRTKEAPYYSLKAREHSWTKHATMMYVDNPVGTGFSYTKQSGGFSKTDEEIAQNLVIFLRAFYGTHPEYRSLPFWVFCESYGGKMAAVFGAALLNASLGIDFRGVAMGDGWQSPVDCMFSYGPFLNAASLLNPRASSTSGDYAKSAKEAVDRGRGRDATSYWRSQQSFLTMQTSQVNWYHIGYFHDYTANPVLPSFMTQNFTSRIRNILPAGVSYGGQSSRVFDVMSDAFMTQSIAAVDYMLNHNLTVVVFTGQKDLIVNNVCTEAWMGKLTWDGMKNFNSSSRQSIEYPSEEDYQVGAFIQSYKNLHYWQILESGHMVPLDNPVMAEYMFATIIGAKTTSIRGNRPSPVRSERLPFAVEKDKLYLP